MLKCPFCQYENEDGVLYCEQCKSDLGVASAAPASPTAEAVPVAAMLEEPTPFAALHDEAATPFGEVEAPPAATPVPAVAEATHAEAPSTLAEATPVAPVSPPPAEAEPPLAAPLEPDRLAPDAKPRLAVLRGKRIGEEYPLYEGHNFIGRADEKPVDIDLEDQEDPDRIWASRQHAVITLEEGRLIIEDLNSANGTFVNRVRIHPGQKRPLKVNDVIQIGTVQMKIKA
jgi:hypothetical protein